MAHAAQPVSLAHAHNSTRLRDSVRQATSQVQRRSRDVGGCPERPCLARGDCCPPGKGCNRAGPSSRDEAGVLQPLLHRTQERWWPSANPGSASLEPGFTQAPVQDADAQAHDQMHSAPGLVCSDRPEGRLLSRFDPSATQTVSTVCVRRSGMAVQGPPLRALPVSPCVHEGCRGRPYPVTGSGRQDPQLPRRLAYSSPIQRAVGRSQGLGAPAPQPVGASGQLGKEQALPALTSIKRVGDLQAFSVSEECLVFGPVYSHVVLRPRPGYVPKVPTTPFCDQVVNLQALPSEEADPALALLCPVRALRIYVTRTRSVRSSEQLFVCHGGQQKGKAVSKQRLAHWIVEAVALAYQSQGEPCPLGVRAHSTRSVASSHALAHGASLADICRAAGWATPNTFARFYNLRVEPVSSRVLGK